MTDKPTIKVPQLVDKTAKTLRMRQNLRLIQSKLKPAEKRFSGVVHQPLLQLISEPVAKTIARPAGLLGGSLVAFLGSIAYEWLTRRYTLTYNYTFFLLFFIVGFALGLIGEYVVVLARKPRR